MADGIPQTFTFSRANQVAQFTGIGGVGAGLPGDGAIRIGYTPNPLDLSDIPGSSAGLMDYCDCDTNTTVYNNLAVATYPYRDQAFLLHSSPIPQFIPIGKDDDGNCLRRPIAGLHNSVRFHAFQEGTLAFHTGAVRPDPE